MLIFVVTQKPFMISAIQADLMTGLTVKKYWRQQLLRFLTLKATTFLAASLCAIK